MIVSFSTLWSVTIITGFLFLLLLLGRLAPQEEMVPAEGIPTLKSVRVLALGCQSTVDNDVPGF